MTKSSWNLLLFAVVTVLFCCLLVHESLAATPTKSRTIYLDEKKVMPIWIKPEVGTVINFPAKPTKAILGATNAFKLEFINDDIVIGVTRSGVQTNLHVYLLGRRFSFKLLNAKTSGDEIIYARDAKEKQMQVDLK